MNEKCPEIKQEISFLELFGYSYTKQKNDYRWIIGDENHNEIGSIQLEKRKNEVTKEDEYLFHTIIDSSLISCDFSRNITSEDDYGNYIFKVKRKDEKEDEVTLRLGKYSRLYLDSEEYGPLQFNVFYKGIHLDFYSKTDNHLFHEILTYYNDPENQEYSYEIRYCDKDNNASNEKDNSIIISGLYTKGMNNANEILLKEGEIREGKVAKQKEEIVNGTIEELAKRHGMGINSVKRFQNLIKDIVPMKKDLITTMLSKKTIEELKLLLFFPKQEKQKKKSLIINEKKEV